MNNKTTKKRKKGFTLIEVTVAMFIFGIIMVATANMFGSVINTKRETGIVQNDYEQAQATLNLIAKVIRTSTMGNSNNSAVNVWDYSQHACVGFRFRDKQVQMAINTEDDPEKYETAKETCKTYSAGNVPGGYESIASITATGGFRVIETNETQRGRVTISLIVEPPTEKSRDKAHTQTSVSLRDYAEE